MPVVRPPNVWYAASQSDSRSSWESRPRQNGYRNGYRATVSTEVPKLASGDSQTRASVDALVSKACQELKSLSGLICIELCAGSAKLSSALYRVGFQAVAVDHAANKHQQRVHCIQIVLAAAGAFALVSSMLEEPNVLYVHVAPPCGTASAARNRPVAAALRAKGIPNPPPLRSKACPEGLPNLSPQNQQRAEQASSIYQLCSRVIGLCLERGIVVSVENPARSLFWDMPCIAKYLSHPGLSSVFFHHCMWGGERDKETLWLGTKDVFESLRLQCDNSHPHKPWTATMVDNVPVFDTAAESEYPDVLCSTVAHIIESVAIARGYIQPANSMSGLLSQDQSRRRLLAAVGKQPRGRKLPQLVSEFKCVSESVSSTGEPPALDKSQSILRRFLRANVGCEESAKKDTVFIIGTRRDPTEFIQAARLAGHPYSPGLGVSDDFKQALARNLSRSPLELNLHRAKAIKRIKELGETLEADEAALHAKLPKHLQQLLSDKKLLLFQRLMVESGFKDARIFDELCNGFDTVGKTVASGLLEPRLKPATSSAQQLRSASRLNNAAVLFKNRTNSDQSLDSEVYRQTLEEKDLGWLQGPMNEQDLDAMFPLGWLAVPRFGIRQGPKTRSIDDCKFPGINTALSTVEKLRLQDTDDLCALVSFVAETIRSADRPDRKFSVVLSSGQMASGVIHPAWGKVSQLKILGRTLDLSAAYKNAGNSEGCLWTCVIAASCPAQRKYQLFLSKALMFGAVSNVYAFNRIAKALQHIATFYLSILANQFFDDYLSLELSQCADDSRVRFEALLTLLGWRCAEGEKAPPFGSVFVALGNKFDVSLAISHGEFFVGNKESRLANINEMVVEARSSGVLRPATAAELAGKLQYSSAQVFGQSAKPAVRVIRQRADSTNGSWELSPELDFALAFVKDFLFTAPPRLVRVDFSDEPVLVFTDGSSELQHLWGAVCFLGNGPPVVAGGEVPKELSDFWLAEVGDQIICQVELFPVLLLKQVLRSRLAGRRVCFYIDNDPARDGLISGASKSSSSRALLYQFARLQHTDPSFNWFARVPSFSNCSDDPSRGRGQAFAKTVGAKFEADWLLEADTMALLKMRC